jgi:hypothetical protein
MAYLLYGIVKAPAVLTPESGDTTRILTIPNRVPRFDAISGMIGKKTGVNGRPVILVEGYGLCAAVSELDFAVQAPPVAELLAYASVIEFLHRRQAVIPMRYGCFLNGIPAILEVLKAAQRRYVVLLAELDGQVEMSIRILLPKKERTPPQGKATGRQDSLSIMRIEERQGETMTNRCDEGLSKRIAVQAKDRSERECENIFPRLTASPKGELSLSGCAYLALRKVHYRLQEETSRDTRGFLDRYLQKFSGLYARHLTKTEAGQGEVILSLYFLIPEGSVNRFRENYAQVTAQQEGESVLSGPWPPYSFVAAN